MFIRKLAPREVDAHAQLAPGENEQTRHDPNQVAQNLHEENLMKEKRGSKLQSSTARKYYSDRRANLAACFGNLLWGDGRQGAFSEGLKTLPVRDV